ncbi:MAG TPA: AbrB/MazE/SpoVT family DNA-binding domain-containing protein [Candidatus Dormibacteraeota bacterium]
MKDRVKPARKRGFTRISGKRQITLPLRIVEALGLVPGDEFRVEAEGNRIVLTREEGLAERRLRAIEAMAGSMPGVYEPGYLDRLRDEWR